MEQVRQQSSESQLIQQVLDGSKSAFHNFVQHYLPKTTLQAKGKLGSDLSRAVEPEEIALSAFRSLWRYLQQPAATDQFSEHLEVLRLLAHMTNQKVARAWRFHTQKRRDIRRTLRNGDVRNELDDRELTDHIPDRSVPPEWQIAFDDTLNEFRKCLSEKQLFIFDMLLQNSDRKQIAQQLNCSMRTIERNISEIRSLLTQNGLDDLAD